MPYMQSSNFQHLMNGSAQDDMLLVVCILLELCQAGVMPTVEHTRRGLLALHMLTTATQLPLESCCTIPLFLEDAIQAGMSRSQRCMLHGMTSHNA